MQSSDEPEKCGVSKNAIGAYDCCVSTQVLNEVCNVLTKKLKMRTDEVKKIIKGINSNCKVGLVNHDTVQKALDLKDKYGYSYYDSLIIASAIESGCEKLFSEDMQDGQIIESTLEIVNIFKGSQP